MGKGNDAQMLCRWEDYNWEDNKSSGLEKINGSLPRQVYELSRLWADLKLGLSQATTIVYTLCLKKRANSG